MGLVTGVITARLLGPVGRGQFATLVVLSTVFASMATLGCNDAVVYFVRNRGHVVGATLATALRAALPVAALAGLALWTVALWQVGDGNGDTRTASVIA